MAKIHVLDKHVAELIAAGEVVERPSSVIKELLENSIDAKANAITVEIRRGGVSYIRITDNGIGINSEDVPVAFLRHATSKVNNASDLDAISSLGFRGEALASVSAVSHVELTTRTAEEEIGTKILIHGGETEYIEEAGCPQGTTIIVRDIFYNVPARMKFLKKDVGEGNAVAAIVDKIALSHPEISFRFIRDNKEVLYTSGDKKMSSAIYAVYGKDFLNGLMPVKYEYQGIKLWGYVSKPANARPNRTMQNFFINGRFIKSRTAMAALDEAFKGSVMVGKFPSAVINLEMDSSLLDVNVHPAKLEVRFVNEKPIFDAIYHAVKTALMQGDKFKEMQLKPAVKTINPYAPVPVKQEQMEIPVKKETINFPELEKTYQAPRQQPSLTLNDSEKNPVEKPYVFTKLEQVLEQAVVPVQKLVEIKEEAKIEIKEEAKVEITKIIDVPLKLIGEAFSAYIVLEYGEGLMLIDKHAAHERLLYEKLKKDSKAYAQMLLSPVSVTLDKMSYDAVLNNLESFEKAGFLIDDFGSGTVIVREAPMNFSGQDISSSVIEIAGYLLKNKTNIETEYLDWVYHNVACRSAIKAGKNSPRQELIDLAKKLEENPELRYCPHGRPVYIIIKKTEIEKQFGRI